MRTFDLQLQRLKECLQVTEDQEVAAALGMKRTAFSNRKQVGSFPERQLLKLRTQRPDFDVMYVLTGQRWTAGEHAMHDVFFNAAALRDDTAVAKSVARGARNHVQVLSDAANDSQVRDLLGILVFCDRPAIEKVERFAASLMGRKLLPFAEREPAGSHLLSPHPQGSNRPLIDEARVSARVDAPTIRRTATKRRVADQPTTIAVAAVPKSRATKAADTPSRQVKKNRHRA